MYDCVCSCGGTNHGGAAYWKDWIPSGRTTLVAKGPIYEQRILIRRGEIPRLREEAATLDTPAPPLSPPAPADGEEQPAEKQSAPIPTPAEPNQQQAHQTGRPAVTPMRQARAIEQPQHHPPRTAPTAAVALVLLFGVLAVTLFPLAWIGAALVIIAWLLAP